MQRLWLTKNGNYVDTNGNIVGSKSKGLTREARQYLQNKYNKDYANRTNANLLAGNIWASPYLQQNMPHTFYINK